MQRITKEGCQASGGLSHSRRSSSDHVSSGNCYYRRRRFRMRFQGRGADGSFERLFLAEAVWYFENRKVGSSCAYKCSDFSLFRLSMFSSRAQYQMKKDITNNLTQAVDFWATVEAEIRQLVDTPRNQYSECANICLYRNPRFLDFLKPCLF
jgi:hypothetical protein